MMKRTLLLLTAIFCLSLPGFASCQTIATSGPDRPPKDFLTLLPSNLSLSADKIMSRAHEVAGGQEWVRPKSLIMDGYAVFYRDGHATLNEHHRMWRIYEAEKSEAHQADGKVRILSERAGRALIDLSYDGTNTYTSEGKQAKSESDKQWASNFGFGVIRNAFDPGYSLSRLPDDMVDGNAVYMVRVTDPIGGQTQFGIDQESYLVKYLGFDTPRGWHERIYSDFYSNPGDRWVQPGRVRLSYNGVKSNEVIWTSYKINQAIPECLFVLPNKDSCPLGE